MWLEDNKDIDLTGTFSAFLCFETVWALPSPFFPHLNSLSLLWQWVFDFIAASKWLKWLVFQVRGRSWKKYSKKKKKKPCWRWILQQNWKLRVDRPEWNGLVCVWGEVTCFVCLCEFLHFLVSSPRLLVAEKFPPSLSTTGRCLSQSHVHGREGLGPFRLLTLSSSFCEAVLDSFNMTPHLSKLAFE